MHENLSMFRDVTIASLLENLLPFMSTLFFRSLDFYLSSFHQGRTSSAAALKEFSLRIFMIHFLDAKGDIPTLSYLLFKPL